MQTLKYPKETRARVTHNCNFCSLKIHVGEIYLKSVHAYDGQVYSWKTHKDCAKIVNRLKMYDHCNHQGLTQDDFVASIDSEHERLMIQLLPKNELQKYSEIIEQLNSVTFRDKLLYVIRYYKKFDNNNLKTGQFKSKIMHVKVKLRLTTGEIKTLTVKIPDDIRDYKQDTIDDAVSDWLDEKGIKYKWYKVEDLKT